MRHSKRASRVATGRSRPRSTRLHKARRCPRLRLVPIQPIEVWIRNVCRYYYDAWRHIEGQNGPLQWTARQSRHEWHRCQPYLHPKDPCSPVSIQPAAADTTKLRPDSTHNDLYRYGWTDPGHSCTARLHHGA